MKKLMFIIFAITFSCGCRVKSSPNKVLKNSEIADSYKISKIDSVNSYYFIYCMKNEHNYKIISKKEANKNVLEKIEEGKYYEFSLNNFPDYSKNNNPLTGYSSTEPCFMLDKDTRVCKEKGVDGLYTTKNLIGLYYVK